jgi:hypothetical protein
MLREIAHAMRIEQREATSLPMSLERRVEIIDVVKQECHKGFRDATSPVNVVWALEQAGHLNGEAENEIARLTTAAILWRLLAIVFGSVLAIVVACRAYSSIWNLLMRG